MKREDIERAARKRSEMLDDWYEDKVIDFAIQIADAALEESATAADNRCHYCTRLCDPTLEDACIACRVARDIRELKIKE